LRLDIEITLKRIKAAIEARAELFGAVHESAFRLFNGFLEGCPELAIDLYGTTLLIYDHAELPEKYKTSLQTIQANLLGALPWVRTVVVKRRNSEDLQEQRGRITYGGPPEQKIREQGVWYAIDLFINRDASFYLDTRNLRNWILNHIEGKTVLNAFAYTGSLGVVAIAAGARHVIQLDRNRTFLGLAEASYRLNSYPVDRKDFLVGDFFSETSRLRHAGMSFDCVLIDPPFFSVTNKGRVNLIGEGQRLINKVRPLVSHDGWLVTINNALYVPGSEYYSALQALCSDGYLAIEELIPVPPDFTGYEQTRVERPLVDPSPFNHSTKIAVLRVKKKKIA
jgi:23S rRNA (cytosine1962-C5)-methyltransferase